MLKPIWTLPMCCNTKMYTVNTHDMIYLERILAQLIGSRTPETILLFHTVHISSGVWHRTLKCCIKCYIDWICVWHGLWHWYTFLLILQVSVLGFSVYLQDTKCTSTLWLLRLILVSSIADTSTLQRSVWPRQERGLTPGYSLSSVLIIRHLNSPLNIHFDLGLSSVFLEVKNATF